MNGSLTTDEAFSLLQKNPMTVRELSDKAGISKVRAYEVVKELGDLLEHVPVRQGKGGMLSKKYSVRVKR